MVLDQHEVSGPVGQDARKRIREALLKQHHHQNHKKLANRIPIVRSFADIGKKQSEPHSMDKNGEQMVWTHQKWTYRYTLLLPWCDYIYIWLYVNIYRMFLCTMLWFFQSVSICNVLQLCDKSFSPLVYVSPCLCVSSTVVYVCVHLCRTPDQ